MSIFRLYTRVLELLGKEARLGWLLGGRQSPAGGLAVRRASAVRPHRRRALRARPSPARTRPGRSSVPGSAFGLFTIVCSALGGAAGRPALAPPAPGGAHRLFRAHPAAAADLSHRHPFGPADEGDARRHRHAVGHVARLLPRALRRDRLARGAAAAVAVHELAAGAAADHALRRLRRADHSSWCARPRRAERGRGALQRTWPSAPPMRSATSRWCRASPASRPRSAACARSPTQLLGAQMPVLSWWALVDGADARLDHHHRAGDLRRSASALHVQGTTTVGEIVDVHELRRPC